MNHVLITGGAGFIGSHLVDSLLRDDSRVTVLDNFHPFYDPRLKEANILVHANDSRFQLKRGDIRRPGDLAGLPDDIDVIVHLAARAGVRPSVEDPLGYQDVNVSGTQRLLEFARQRDIRQFVFASSSSVYGVNPRVPWSEEDNVLLPISPYASTKVSGELMGHVYSHLYGIRFIALRFFTVYGPRQRPDLAIHKFARRLLTAQPIVLYGDGSSRRDYTYIDDVIQGIRGAIAYADTRYEVINLGNSDTVTLTRMVRGLEEALGIRAVIQNGPPEPGDVPQTWASIDKARRLLGYQPHTSYEDGVVKFVDWLRAAPGIANA
jgi:UDP-glucuronate 4-epimerase